MIAMLRAITVTLFISLLMACTSNISPEGDETTSGPEAASETVAAVLKAPAVATKIRIKELWSDSVGDDGDYLFGFTPAVDAQRVCAAAHNGEVACYEPVSGKRLWKVDLDQSLSAGPALGEGLVVVGTDTAKLIALNATTGKIVWQASVTGEVLSSPAVGAGIVAVRSGDGRLYGLDAINGTRIWAHDQNLPTLTQRGTSSPVIANERVIAGFDNGRLVALQASNGRPQWRQAIATATGRNEIERMVDVDATPVVVGDSIYAVAFNGRLANLDLTKGRPLWDRELSSYVGLTGDSRRVFVVDDKNALRAFEGVAGRQLWVKDSWDGQLGTPALHAKHVIVGDEFGNIVWLNAETGGVAASRDVSGRVRAAPVVRDGRAFVLSTSGRLTVFAID